MTVVAGLGIGGTHFHSAVGTPEGGVRDDIFTEPTDWDDLAGQIERTLAQFDQEMAAPVEAVAVASKGLVDRSTGQIELIDITGGPTIEEFPIVAVIRDVVDVPVYVENDCIAAALAEYHFGTGVNADSLVHVTIGTGIGAGVIDRGHVVRGTSNYAGEVGGLRVGPDHGLEWCGIPGAWEAYCSGPGIAEYVADQLTASESAPELRQALAADDPTPEIFALAEDGHSLATVCLRDVAEMNARALATISNLFDPGLITLGGGVATNHPEFLLKDMQRNVTKYLIGESPRIDVTNIENLGIVGAFAQVAHAERTAPHRADALSLTD